MSVFAPKDRLGQRSANLYLRQWARLGEISGAEGIPIAEVLRNVMDLGLKTYDELARAKEAKKKPRG